MKRNLLHAIVFIAVFCGCKKEKGPAASFELSKPVYYLTEPMLLSNNTIDATSYAWDFGDGHKSTEKDPQYTYPQDGTFKIKLTVNGGATTTRTVRILPGPASYEVRNNTSIALPLFSFAVDPKGYIINYHEHGMVPINGKSDTIYTKDSDIFFGGTLDDVSFITFYPNTITKFAHNSFEINDQTQVYIQDGLKEKRIQSLPGKNAKRQSLKSIQ